MADARAEDIRKLIREVPDFPKPGILFYDITTVLKNPAGLRATVDLLVEALEGRWVDKVVAMESRGFIFGAPVAARLGAGFVPVRKPGKLPAATTRASYELEYGKDSLEIHTDAIVAGDRVAIVDDLLATGGTAQATTGLVESLGGEVVVVAFVVELDALGGRAKLGGQTVVSLLHY
jgi:adenine phosphoribosyltransferase